MRDDAVLRRALPLGRGLGPTTVRIKGANRLISLTALIARLIFLIAH